MSKYSYLQRFGEVELAVRRSGAGVPFVWGHSLMGSMRVEDRAGLWDWERLERHAQIVRYDARGHGNSDGSYRGEDYQWQHMAADMLAVADAVATEAGAGRCILGGISMGAATALQAAVQQPRAVAGLVLALPPTAWDTRPRQAAVYRQLARVSGIFGAAPYRLLDLLPIPTREDGRSRLALHTMKGLARANPLHVQAALRGAARSDMVEPDELRDLRVPTLILAWEDDTAHPLSTATALAEHLPDVRALVICDPEDTTPWGDALADFVRELAGEGRRRRSPRRGTRASAA
ncbi:MAG: alpha/beta hydrolase [Halioglobus sp.]|nr:alpha/beta hydrolase [Halioglobus sp.]